MPFAELDGRRIHYKVRGEGPAVLGVMGFALDQRYWASQIPAITPTHSLITLDNRGVGRSTGEPPTTMEEMAEDAVAVLDHLGVEKAVVFGMSMGGAVAQHIVLDHPDRVSALILGVTWARPIDFMRRQSELARLIIEAGGPETFMQITLVRMFTPRFFEAAGEVLDQMVAALFAETGPDAAGPEVLAAQLDAVDKHDVLDRLGEISVPTLVLGGKMDMMVPGFASEEIAATIPGAELDMFETGHGCMIEEMDAFNARVSAFLQSLV
jgi:pimeloyl-ACP methyl ester carboxylesterase